MLKPTVPAAAGLGSAPLPVDVAHGNAQPLSAPYIDRMTKLTVWHDGTCPLCRREIALMRRLDTRGAIRFVDATMADAGACPTDRRELLARFHADEGGTLLSGAAAFVAMWRPIPVLRPLGLLARSPLVLRVLERMYLAFLRVRPGLQHLARAAAPA